MRTEIIPFPTMAVAKITNLVLQIRAGTSVGHSPNESQWTPDMRKDEKDVTEQDKKDAKRRIQGSLSLEESPEDSDDSPVPSQGIQGPI